MSCSQTSAVLAAYQDGTLGADQKLVAHLEGCTLCERAVTTLFLERVEPFSPHELALVAAGMADEELEREVLDWQGAPLPISPAQVKSPRRKWAIGLALAAAALAFVVLKPKEGPKMLARGGPTAQVTVGDQSCLATCQWSRSREPLMIAHHLPKNASHRFVAVIAQESNANIGPLYPDETPGWQTQLPTVDPALCQDGFCWLEGGHYPEIELGILHIWVVFTAEATLGARLVNDAQSGHLKQDGRTVIDFKIEVTP